MPPARKSKKSAKGKAKPYDKKAGKKEDPLFKSTPRNFSIGGDVRPRKTDVGRFVRWPKNVRIQRQRKVLYQRLKVPPAINQFTNTLDKNQATELFRLLSNYQPETKAAKKERLKAAAEAKAAGGGGAGEKPPPVIKFGLNHVTQLVEKKKAKLVVIAHDVNPIELVVWLPALCRHMGVPYCVVKGKSRLGTLVHQKNATCIALTAVSKEHTAKLATLQDAYRSQYNDNADATKKWGGGIVGLKTSAKLKKRADAVAAEEQKKALLLK